MSVTTKSIGKAYQSVKVFNKLAGNLDKVNEYSVDTQLDFIFEELQETITAFETRDEVGLIDGVCDLFVTVVGLMQKLEVAGFDVDTALQRVNDNNLSKFVVSTTAPIVKGVQGYTYSFNKEFGRWVIKDQNGKVKKPTEFVPVCLDDLVPNNFLKGE